VGEVTERETKAFLLAQRNREYLQGGNLVEVVGLDDLIGRVNRQVH
jgi:hypothetical protein